MVDPKADYQLFDQPRPLARILDRPFRTWAGNARRMAELRVRLEQELGRKPTEEETFRAWLEEYDEPGET